MKKLTVTLTVLMLGAIQLSPASSQEPERRIEEGTYASAGAGSTETGGVINCANQNANGCVRFPGGPETFVNVAIADESGESVAGRVSLSPGGTRTYYGNFCTTTSESIEIVANENIDILIYAGDCDDGTPSTPSTGAVTISLTTEPEPNPLVAGEPEPEPSTDPEPEPEPSTEPDPDPGTEPEPEPGGEQNLDGPGVRLRFSSRTPAKGGTFKAKALLLKCKGHAGTNVQIRRKKHGTFEKVATGKLDRNCTAIFKLRSNFSKATYRAVWPSQDKDHGAGRSAAKIVVPR